jgi:hypothetical protein
MGDKRYVGPQAIVAAHRFIFDSRDRWRCRTVFNCTDCCPRGIKVTQAITDVKRALLFECRVALDGRLCVGLLRSMTVSFLARSVAVLSHSKPDQDRHAATASDPLASGTSVNSRDARRRGGRRTRAARSGCRAWKLWWGGGELVAHSRLLPSHGSSPAASPRRTDRQKFQRNTRIETAIR